MAHLIAGKRTPSFEPTGIRLMVDVGGKKVHALVTDIALSDRSQGSMDPSDWEDVIDRYADQIAKAVERKVRQNIKPGSVVLVGTLDFPN